MKLIYTKINFLFVFVLVLPLFLNGQNNRSIWTKISKEEASRGELLLRRSQPIKADYYNLDISALKNNLNSAPLRSANQNSNVIISLPNADGSMENYRVLEASVMHPDLQARHQNIRSYVGQGVENPANLVRFSVTPQGLHTMKFSAQGGVEIIDPYSRTNNTYVAYKKADLPWPNEGFECGFVNQIPDSLADMGDLSQRNADDGNLREYRLAIATTIEYAQYHWQAAGLTSGDTEADKKAAVLAELNVLMTRVNGIYERDLSITMTLVGNNEDIIFIDSDNFSNSNAGTLINESQSEIDAIIGSANYDIGHTASTGGGGLAGLGVVCIGGNKARGITGLPTPVGDVYYVDYVSHEMGHQFGANHSFNGSTGNCAGGNRNSSTAYEPGSGNTIMAYAGICAPQDVQPTSDAFFHQVSLFEIWNYVSTGGGSSCPTTTPTGNLAPTAQAGPSYTIPISTPYMLVGSSTDGDGISTHTFTWEEYDLGPAGAPTETTATGPMVRSFEGTTDNVRYIPRLSDIIASGGVSTTWEKLPSISRDMDFKLTVRDNDSRGGQIAVDDMTVTTSDTAGPFVVTSQTTNETWNVGSTQTVTWDVAGTDSGAVNTPNVDIFLSTDGGLTFPNTVATSVPNTGSASVTVPSVGASSTVRIMVVGSGNIFFSVNSTNFSTQESEFVLTVADTSVDVCAPSDAVYNITYNTFLGFSGTTTFSTTGLPAGATAVYSPPTATADATAVTATISGTGSLTAGNYTFTLVGTSGAITSSAIVEMNVYNTSFGTLNLTAPADGATDVAADNAMFAWDSDANAESYEIDIAADAGFTTIVESGTPSSNGYTTTSLTTNTPYFWRVRAVNACGTGSYSTAGFTTANISCNSFASTDTPVAIPDGSPDGIDSVLNIGTTSLISDVNVTVNITHTWDDDLIININQSNWN